jgi:Holliday junction resolvase RusA-like endonuclease
VTGRTWTVELPAGTRLSDVGSEAAAFTLFREQFDAHVVARFTVDGEPVSKARARFTKQGSKTQAYTPDKTRAAEEAVGWKFRQSAPGHKPDPDATYGVIGLFFSGTRQRRDVDNMLKLILDGLNKIAWADDDQVVEVSGRKSLGDPEHARTEVVVYRVGMVDRPTGTCEHCGKDYPAFRSQKDRRFCSQACHIAWRRERSRKTCPTCGEDFQSYKVDRPSVYCSMACAAQARRATVACSHCGREFTKPRCHVRATNYCSDECRETHWRDHRKTAAKGICESCGGPTSKKTYLMCRPCRIKARAQASLHITELEA